MEGARKFQDRSWYVVRVGEWGGHMLVDCDDPLTVHKACSTFPAFEFQARPVIAVEDAVGVELEVHSLARRTEGMSGLEGPITELAFGRQASNAVLALMKMEV